MRKKICFSPSRYAILFLINSFLFALSWQTEKENWVDWGLWFVRHHNFLKFFCWPIMLQKSKSNCYKFLNKVEEFDFRNVHSNGPGHLSSTPLTVKLPTSSSTGRMRDVDLPRSSWADSENLSMAWEYRF